MSKWLLLGMIGLIVLTKVVNQDQVDAQSAPDERFGMTEVFWLPEEAHELGIGWERILFYWREIQPQGPDDWNTLHVREEWLAQANSQGRSVVGLIKNTAPWASTDGTEAGLPKGLYLPADDPDNLWAGYVRRLAAYYGRRNVHHWIIWNEPEIRDGVYGYEFAGSVEDYYQLLKTAYKVIKETDPQAIVHLAGLTWWHDPTFLDRLLAVASADPESQANGYFFDVISLHIYFRTETVKTIIKAVEETQGRYGLNKPIWINETNAPPNRDPEWPVDRPSFDVDLDQQAWFIVQAMALGFASGADRVSVYKLIDIHLPPGGESFGLVRPDYSRRPAYYAYRLAARCFGEFTDVELTENPDYYRVTFTRTDSLTHVAWSRTPVTTTVQIPASSAAGWLVDWEEATTEISSSDGYFTLELPGQECSGECNIGGKPLVLVDGAEDSGRVDLCLHDPELVPESSQRVSAEGSVPLHETLALQMAATYAASQAKLAPDAATGTATPSGSATVATARPASARPGPPVLVESDILETADSAGAGRSRENLVVVDPEPTDDGRNHTIGLWFLGAGVCVALGVALIHRRRMSDR